MGITPETPERIFRKDEGLVSQLRRQHIFAGPDAGQNGLMIALGQARFNHRFGCSVVIIAKSKKRDLAVFQPREPSLGPAVMRWHPDRARIYPTVPTDLAIKCNARVTSDDAIDLTGYRLKRFNLMHEIRLCRGWPEIPADRCHAAVDHCISAALMREKTDVGQIVHPLAIVSADIGHRERIPLARKKIANRLRAKPATAIIRARRNLALAIAGNDRPAARTDKRDGFGGVRTIRHDVASADGGRIANKSGKGIGSLKIRIRTAKQMNGSVKLAEIPNLHVASSLDCPWIAPHNT